MAARSTAFGSRVTTVGPRDFGLYQAALPLPHTET